MSARRPITKRDGTQKERRRRRHRDRWKGGPSRRLSSASSCDEIAHASFGCHGEEEVEGDRVQCRFGDHRGVPARSTSGKIEDRPRERPEQVGMRESDRYDERRELMLREREEALGKEAKMMMAPQIVGVLLKKPGQQTHPRLPPLDPQETKIKGKHLAFSSSVAREAESFGDPHCECTLSILSSRSFNWRNEKEVTTKVTQETLK